jgi:hypothetical protein
MADVRARIEGDELFLDSGIVSHGYAPNLRDYEIVIDVAAALPAGVPMRNNGSYIMGRYQYRFTHCPECRVLTSVADAVWRVSWDDVFVDYATWEAAGHPDGFVWGVNWALAYPGLTYVADSPLAASWSERLEHEMHEVEVETNTFTLRLVAADLVVRRLSVGDPVTGELTNVAT